MPQHAVNEFMPAYHMPYPMHSQLVATNLAHGQGNRSFNPNCAHAHQLNAYYDVNDPFYWTESRRQLHELATSDPRSDQAISNNLGPQF